MCSLGLRRISPLVRLSLASGLALPCQLAQGRPMNSHLDRLLTIMASLRDPVKGCPWDVEQTFSTIAPYTIEEAYEVADAIDRGNMHDLREELGDLLLQVVFHARMAQELGVFDFESVAKTIADKMVERHPHVFAEDRWLSRDQVREGWEGLKAQERAEKARRNGAAGSAIDGVALALPALLRAEKLTKRAARVGFDWSSADQIFAKIEEEIAELRAEIRDGAPEERLRDEVGDLLFCIANLARHLKLDPEDALRSTNAKFDRRFRAMEAALTQAGQSLEDSTLDVMEAGWQAAKSREPDPDANPT